jgi:hypothetical protein
MSDSGAERKPEIIGADGDIIWELLNAMGI